MSGFFFSLRKSSMYLLGTFSEDGWLEPGEVLFDRIMSYFLVADFSQSNEHMGLISSFPAIIQSTQGDLTQTTMVTRQTLERYLSRYFTNVVVEVAEVVNDVDPKKTGIRIYASATDAKGNVVNLGRTVLYSGSLISEIININNGV